MLDPEKEKISKKIFKELEDFKVKVKMYNKNITFF